VNETRFARRAAPPTEKQIWLERLRDWSGAGWVLAMLLALGGWYVYSRVWEARDAAGAPEQTAVATVVDRRAADSRGRAGSGWHVTLKWDGRTAVARTHNLPLVSRLAIGGTVGIAYRVGQSGRIYVDDIAEAPKQRATASPAAR